MAVRRFGRRLMAELFGRVLAFTKLWKQVAGILNHHSRVRYPSNVEQSLNQYIIFDTEKADTKLYQLF
ncbi:hypothetical protein N9045_01300 [bacterium]|nr:hypothetical protein [bacterium]